ncbi:MAG: PEGA domain-containing protein [Patescibacteria group bacterium]
MSIQTRRLLFLGFVILFIPLSLGVLLFAQGWRISQNGCQLTDLLNCQIGFKQTGALYIETEPQDVKISLDENFFTDQSSFINNGTLITNLNPKTYNVKIKKENYFPYFKKIKIEPPLVSEIINAILIPEKITPSIASLQKLRGEEIIAINSDYKKIIVKNKKTGIYYLHNFSNQSSAVNLSSAFDNLKKNYLIEKIAFHPFDEQNKFIIESAGGLYILDTLRIKLDPILKPQTSKKLLAWSVKNPNIYIATENIEKKSGEKQILKYEISFFNLVAKANSPIIELSSEINNYGFSINEIAASDSLSKIGLLNSAGDIHLIDIQNKEIKQIAHNAKSFKFSPDNKKLAFFDNDNKLNVYFIEEWRKNIIKNAGESISLNSNEQKPIEKIFWRNESYHLIAEEYYDASKEIHFLEIDNREPLNRHFIIKDFDSAYYQNNVLYFIKDNSLYSVKI